jgi:hypothetical protein
MTQAEHALILGMFVKQAQISKTIIEILKSRGIVSGDDLPAFEYGVNTDASSTAELVRDLTNLYNLMAKTLRIETGITIRE